LRTPQRRQFDWAELGRAVDAGLEDIGIDLADAPREQGARLAAGNGDAAIVSGVNRISMPVARCVSSMARWAEPIAASPLVRPWEPKAEAQTE
jgi:hypothetical protein